MSLELWLSMGASATAIGLFIFDALRFQKEVKERKETNQQYDEQLKKTEMMLKNQKEEIKKMQEQIELDDYQNIREDHQELMRMQISQPFLQQIWKNVAKPENKTMENLTDDESALFCYYVLQFDLLERVHYHFTKVEKDEENELEDWLKWTKPMANHWLFEFTLREYEKRGLDKKFADWIDDKLIKKTQN